MGARCITSDGFDLPPPPTMKRQGPTPSSSSETLKLPGISAFGTDLSGKSFLSTFR